MIISSGQSSTSTLITINMYSQEDLGYAVDIQKYLTEEIQKYSDLKFGRKSSRKTRYFFSIHDSFIVSNKKHADEMKLIFEMVDNVSEKSKKNKEVITVRSLILRERKELSLTGLEM